MAKRRSKSGNSSRPANARGFRPFLEAVERRELLAIIVFSNGDAGRGTLRDAINIVNAGSSDNDVQFNIPSSLGSSISLNSELPPIVQPIVIEGFTQPGGAPNTAVNFDNATIPVTLDGQNGGFRGLVFAAGAAGSSVSGLNLLDFSHNAIEISTDQVHVFGNSLGVLHGTIGSSSANAASGVAILDGSHNTIGGTTLGERNLISGNAVDGVQVTGGSSNVVLGNFIGVDGTGGFFAGSEGSLVPGNGRYGIEISGSANNTLGGAGIASRNVVSGNRVDGIRVEAGSDGTLVINQVVGLVANGSSALANVNDGLAVVDSTSTTIGGTTSGQGNVISGNGRFGVRVESTTGSPTSATLLGNLVGLDSSGLAARPNASDGVFDQGVSDLIGAGNTISGNDGFGVNLDATSNLVSVQGSTIGLNSAGDPAPNARGGILAAGQSATIGGLANVISGNFGSGVLVTSRNGGTSILSNLIGLDPSGTAARGNQVDGILIAGGSHTTIDGAVVSGNGEEGIAIEPLRVEAENTIIRRSIIGLGANGLSSIGNTQNGILIAGALSTTIGGETGEARNLISGNGANGVLLKSLGGSISGTILQGNFIGLDKSGTHAVGNSANGLAALDGDQLQVGTVGFGNVISGNEASGVYLSTQEVGSQPHSSASLVANTIGLDVLGAEAVANRGTAGIFVYGRSHVAIGGDVAGMGNVVSGNQGDGIRLGNSASSSNSDSSTILGNKVGLDGSGRSAIGNGGNGVTILDFRSTQVGGPGASGNLISGNKGDGLAIFDTQKPGNSSGTQVLGNTIGLSLAGNPLGNSGNGVSINQASGIVVGPGNVVSSNHVNGIAVLGAPSGGNRIVGNTIGGSLDGLTRRGNQLDGILLVNAVGNTIGGLDFASRNVVSGNGETGVEIAGGSANGVYGNIIGLGSDGSIPLANGSVGVFLNESAGNTIGSPGGSNVISNPIPGTDSGLTTTGIELLGGSATGNLIQSNRVGLDALGKNDRGNLFGIVLNNAPGNTIGGASAAFGNVVSGNDDVNIQVFGAGASRNLIQGNIVGLSADGTTRLSQQRISNPGEFPNDPDRLTDPRSRVGIQVDRAPATFIVANTITDNRVGVGLSGVGSTTLVSNGIGVNTLGLVVGPDSVIRKSGNDVGVFVNDSPRNVIGQGGQGNLIAGNFQAGIELFGVLTTGNTIQANSIIANGQGIFVESASNNSIGGPTAALGNDLLSNSQTGLFFFGATTSGNSATSNRIDRSGRYGALFVDTGRANSVASQGAGANTITRSGISDSRIFHTRNVPKATVAVRGPRSGSKGSRP